MLSSYKYPNLNAYFPCDQHVNVSGRGRCAKFMVSLQPLILKAGFCQFLMAKIVIISSFNLINRMDILESTSKHSYLNLAIRTFHEIFIFNDK